MGFRWDLVASKDLRLPVGYLAVNKRLYRTRKDHDPFTAREHRAWDLMIVIGLVGSHIARDLFEIVMPVADDRRHVARAAAATVQDSLDNQFPFGNPISSDASADDRLVPRFRF